MGITKQIEVDYYSDILCVWAWFAQKRIDELKISFGNKIKFNYHYIDIFGDVDTKIQKQWKERGLYKGFSEHVADVANQFDPSMVNSKIWSATRPKTSGTAHLFLKAITLGSGEQDSIEFALNLRKAFFLDCQDIGHHGVLNKVAIKQGLDLEEIQQYLLDGSAMSALMSDYQFAIQKGIKGSPSFVLDNGRQVLYGNVGYRVLKANIDELLKSPSSEASWC